MQITPSTFSKYFKRIFLFLLGSVLLLSSCELDEFSLETDTFGIRHDVDLEEYEALGQNLSDYSNFNLYPDFSAVCAITYLRDGDPIDATGVLIAPNWIMTAAHNLLSGDESLPDPLESSMEVMLGNDFINADLTVSVQEFYLHPGWAPNQGEGREAAVDIALLKLVIPITDRRPALYANSTNEGLGQVMYVAGFGDYSQILDTDNIYSEKHAFENTIDRLTQNITLDYAYEGNAIYTGGMMGCDFDSPVEYANALDDESTESSNIEVRSLGEGSSSSEPLTLEGTTVPGDSGGPAFAKIQGQWKVIGITSSGSTDSNYGDVGIFTRVSSHTAWIESVLK